MAKKNKTGTSSKNAVKELVEKKLESLLASIEPGIGKKKISKKVKRAGKILVKGIKSKKTNMPPGDVKEVIGTA